MTGPLSNQVEQAMAEFERQKAAIGEIQSGLAATVSTVTAKNRAVEVTVDSQGAVATIKFPTSAYRTMSGSELGELLVATIRSARAEAMARTVAAFDAVLPAGVPMLDLLTGAGAGDDADDRMPLDRLLTEILRGTDEEDEAVPGASEHRGEAG